MTTKPTRPSAAYEKRKADARARIMQISREGRDIGEIPKVAKPKRRKACERDIGRFCQTYLAGTFHLPFSDDHRKVIASTETVVFEGGQLAVAMPRGSGKTSIAEAAALHAVLYGHRNFVALVGSDLGSAVEMLDSIKVELESNELLLEDFPEVCFPTHCLERISLRCRGQTLGGVPTRMEWLADTIVLPTVKGSKASGAIIKVAGIEGRVRGMKHKRADGQSVRPDLCLVDDPQTDASARSASQCEYRFRVLQGAILGLAGPKRKIACLMPCTVIQPGDVADRCLTPGVAPGWRGERTKMLYGEPENPKVWDDYANLRSSRGQEEATAFYLENQESLDAGLRAAWQERYDPGQASAIQHAMDLKIDKPEVFAAEYQNDPQPLSNDEAEALTPDEVISRTNSHARGLIPAGFSRVTCGIDVQGDLLYWLVAAWKDDFTGAVIDYGAFPEQPRSYFTLREANPTLARVTGVSSLEGSLHAGLELLAHRLLGREFPVDGGGALRIERCLVDANWGQSTDTVYAWCRQSVHMGILTPAHGKAIGLDGSPMSEWQPRPGERSGLGWKLRPAKAGRAGRYLLFDANLWKTFVAARIRTAMGERGALTVFGSEKERHLHRMLADHVCAEYPVRKKRAGRELDEWKERPDHRDNHFWDTLVGASLAASVAGCALSESQSRPQTKKRKVGWGDFAKAAGGK